MRQARLAKMHLGVDDAGQDVQTLAVDHFSGVAADIAEGNDPPAAHRDIGEALAVLIDHSRVLENRVVLRHVLVPPCLHTGGLTDPSSERQVSMTIYLRADRAVFRFSGPDAHKLLNDVITGHVPAADGPAAWWALLSPQGKILAEGLAGWAEDALWLDVHQSVADDFFKRMKMYRLRAAVVIDDLRETHRVGFASKAAG